MSKTKFLFHYYDHELQTWKSVVPLEYIFEVDLREDTALLGNFLSQSFLTVLLFIY